MEFNEVIRNRYACRKYDDRQVEQPVLERILDAGRIAPTSVDQQEQHITVIRSDDGLATVDALTECRYGAPVVLLVTFARNDVYTYPGGRYGSGVEDASIALTHMMLAATDAGLASCWVNAFDPDKARKAFAVPDGEEIVAMLDLGYPADDTEPSAKHAKRKSLDELVSYR
ncbi:nitroreductase family protein [Bifidobacterium simiarum]|uniref:Nitroreductase n=1 Tax=Bifidobacterium simiarum TaxID=2045441 RepID=A0A2M9HDD2_9BIFI|nr:nitroreductase family protein [Bifidobacterium simiarum]PJM74811.1 nitroreductase [Bifidobacterium simiarum]